jgi:hypothetical protein
MTTSGAEPNNLYLPKWLLAILGIVALASLVAASIWFISSRKHQHSALIEVPQAQVVSASAVAKQLGTPSPSGQTNGGGLTILFYYDGFTRASDALRYVGLLQGALKTTEPYASASSLSTRVFTSPSQKCHVVRKGQNLLQCDKSLIPEINQLGIKHFKLVVLSPLNFVPNASVARGKNSVVYLPAYQGALTPTELDTFLSRFFLHELGHGFGLRDEYAFQRPAGSVGNKAAAEAPSSSVAYQPGRPNCAPDKATAQAWWGIYLSAKVPGVGLQTGCAGKPQYYYPVQGTLMSDNPQQANYGIVSEDYIRGVLDCFYGTKASIDYPSKSRLYVPGLATSCSGFRWVYAGFWGE